MDQPSYKLRSTADSLAIYDPARLDEGRAVRPPEPDPFHYGYRTRWEKAPDGSEKLRWIPLTYEDTLNPQLGDQVANDTVHSKMTGNVSGVLEMRYLDDPTVAVWSNLKVRTPGDGKGNRARRTRRQGLRVRLPTFV